MLDFPASPTFGQIYIGPNSAWRWDGEKWAASSIDPTFGAIKNALDYGIANNGTTDTTNAIRAFVQSGGVCFFPPGRYIYNGPYAILYSNTKVCGAGANATIFVPGTNVGGGHQDPAFGYIFVNNLYDINGAYVPQATTPALQTDVNIEISDIGFDLTNSVTKGVALARMLWAKNVRIRNISADNFAASTASKGWSGFSFLGCDLYSVENFYARNCQQAVDQWQGCTRAKLHNIWAEAGTDAANGGLINWQGVGTTSIMNISDDLQISDCTFWLNNSIALFLDGFSSGSKSQNILVNNVSIVARSGTASVIGVVFRGLVNRLVCRGVSFAAVPGADMRAFLVGGFYDATAALTVPGGMVTTTNGSTSATVNYPCNSGVGNMIRIDNGASGAITGNGVTLNGWYPITAVAGNVRTITIPTAATASGLIAVNTRALGFLGAASNVTLSGITIDGCGASGGDLIRLGGQGHVVDGVTVTRGYTGGSAVPTYRSVISLDSTECLGIASPAQSYVGNVVAEASAIAVPGGYTGDGIVQWTAAGLGPVVPSTLTQPMGTDNTTLATTAFVQRTHGISTPTAPDVNTVFTAATVGARAISFNGLLTANRTYTFPVTGNRKNWVVRNGTTGGFMIGIVGTAGPTLWIPAGNTVEVWTDGANMLYLHNMLNGLRVGDGTRNAFVATYGAASTNPVTLSSSGSGGLQLTSNVGFNSAAPIAKPAVTGAKGGNLALTSLLAALVSYGLITDTTTT